MSTSLTATIITETTFPLLEWIRRAIAEVDLSTFAAAEASIATPDSSQWPAEYRRSLALCSGEYLMSALRVARSLAEEICNGHENNNLPSPSTNWSDRVQVHVLSSGAGGDEMNNLLFSFKKADFASSDVTPESDGQSEDEIRCIYSLGIVLYEILSGGERPPELNEQKGVGAGGSDDDTADLFHDEWSPEASGKFDPLPFDDDGSDNIVERAAELSIFDDIGLDGLDAFAEDIEGGDLFNAANPRTRKRQTQSYNYEVFNVSVEPLKAKSIPGSLCDMVANMLGCGGSNHSEDMYQSISEVRDDLQLMLDKPTVYLYDQDMGRLSITGLQLGGAVFGRNAELSAVKDAYRRSVSGQSEMVMISGASGTGKSLLGYEFGKHVLSEGGIFLSGKFDQLQQGKPFSALATAFDDYCGILLEDNAPSSIAGVLATKLMSSMEGDVHHLTKLIPNLATILGPGPDVSDINHFEDCVNAEKRLQYLLCKFVEVVSSTFSAPVTLFLDDLQWADAASANAVNQLLTATETSQQGKQFLFLGCCREGEVDERHPISKLIGNIERSSVGFRTIRLDLMEEATINVMVSESLCLLPRFTRSLSSMIYRKTKGNPLFVSRLMLSLSKEGLLRPSLSRCRWEWDEEKIECWNLPDDVAVFLNNSIRELPEDVQSSLCVLSCFGASADISFIETLERALDQSIRVHLDFAVEKGLLDIVSAQYRFSHDRIQEATYNMMGEEVRRLFHFTYGLSLASLSIDESSDSILFIAVNQLNLGGPAAVQDPSQSFTIADMNLRAGKRAMQMSDFTLASSYLDHGIEFLPERHWEEHYDLSLELFEMAAKCAHTNGKHENVKLLCEKVLEMARSFEEKLEVAYTYIRSLLNASLLGDALTKGLFVLNELGIVLSGDLETLLLETKTMLAEYSDEELLSLPIMADETKLMAMKFLSRMQTCLLHTNPESQPKATFQMVRYSLQHGISSLSSVGFAFYGSFLACRGDIPAGYRYVKLAIKLAENLNARDCMCDVLVVGSQVMGYVEPLQSVNDIMVRSHEYGLIAGNSSNAMLSLSLNTTCAFWSGKQLSFVKKTIGNMLRIMSSHSILVWILQTLPLYRTVLAIVGNVEDVPTVLGGRADIETEKERKMCDTNLHLLKVAHFNKMYLSFIFRRYDELKQLAAAYDAIASLPFSTILISHSMHVFYGGLINFWIARMTMDVTWFDRGEEAIQKIKAYAACSPWNFQNKLLLLQAEQCFYLEDFDSATRYYDAAILSAKEHKFVHEEALACELAGYFLLESGEGSSARPYLLLAQQKYHEWGADAKEEKLKAFIEEQFRDSGATLEADNSPCIPVEQDVRKRRAS